MGLRVENIKVRFSYKSVLNGVTLEFEGGKVYSILGENGEGKSTLARVLCGDIQPDEGKLFVENQPVTFKNPAAAIKSGICCVHQRPFLSDSISILDNLRIGNFKFDKKKSIALLQKWLPGTSEKELVKNLSIEQRFYVSLCGTLLKNPSVLIVDEPPEFFDIHSLKNPSLIVILITHNIEDAVKKSDEIILLKDGMILDKLTSGVFMDETELASLSDKIKEALFSVNAKNFQELKLPSKVKIIRTATVKEFIQKEDELTFNSSSGTGIIPSDKVYRGSNPNLTILQMLTAKKAGSQKELEEYAEKICKKAKVNIKITEKAENLSGGMLQRLILEREIQAEPEQLILCEPFKGLDFAASRLLCDRMEELIASGCKITLLECSEERS